MSKIRKPAPRVHKLPSVARPPREVPDCNRPLLNDRGKSPGGLPPASVKPGWQPIRGSGVRYHTHS